MKRVLFGLLFAVVLVWNGQAQDDIPRNTGIVLDMEGWLIFVESVPKARTKALGDVKATSLMTTLKEDFLLKKMIKKAQKDFPEGQGMVMTGDLAFGEVITFNLSNKRGGSSRKSKGEEDTIPMEHHLSDVNEQPGGKLAFVKSKPKVKYNELGEVAADLYNDKYKLGFLMKDLMAKAEAQFPEYDAIIFVEGSNLHKAKVVKFQ